MKIDNLSTVARRRWLQLVPAGLACCLVPAHADTLLAESDAEALAVDYKADAATVDQAKFPKYAVGQTCANCSLFAPDGDKPTGGCGLFLGKDVAAKGWCSAWEKKVP